MGPRARARRSARCVPASGGACAVCRADGRVTHRRSFCPASCRKPTVSLRYCASLSLAFSESPPHFCSRAWRAGVASSCCLVLYHAADGSGGSSDARAEEAPAPPLLMLLLALSPATQTPAEELGQTRREGAPRQRRAGEGGGAALFRVTAKPSRRPPAKGEPTHTRPCPRRGASGSGAL